MSDVFLQSTVGKLPWCQTQCWVLRTYRTDDSCSLPTTLETGRFRTEHQMHIHLPLKTFQPGAARRLVSFNKVIQMSDFFSSYEWKETRSKLEWMLRWAVSAQQLRCLSIITIWQQLESKRPNKMQLSEAMGTASTRHFLNISQQRWKSWPLERLSLLILRSIFSDQV